MQQQAINQVFTQLRCIQETQSRTTDALHVLGRDVNVSTALLSNPDLSQNSLSLSVKRPGSHQESSGILKCRVSQIRRVSCSQNCSCICHVRRYSRTPRIFDNIIGSLFLGYSSIPVLTPNCDKSSCSRYSYSIVTVMFLFPRWLFYRLLLITITNSRRDGPEVYLKMVRIRSASSTIFANASSGNITSIQRLFQRGEASPFDIDDVYNRSVLEVSSSILFLRVDR